MLRETVMFFVRVDGALDPVTLEQVASLFAANCTQLFPALPQPDARNRIAGLVAGPNAILCVGSENNEAQAFSLGVTEMHPQGATLVLHAFCVARELRRQGLGTELMVFTMRSALDRGTAQIAVMKSPHVEYAAFLDALSFSPPSLDGLRHRAIRVEKRE